MNKIRDHTGVVLWILVIAFGVIWTLQDSGAFETTGAPGDELIVVDGDAVTLDQYNRAVEAQIQQLEQRTGESLPPQQREAVEDRVYEMLINDKLREHEMDRLGITVTDEEVYSMVMGDDPHPIIRANFGDGQGGIDRARLQSFIDAPEARDQWIQIEEYLRADRRQQKLDKLIEASVHVSEQDVLNEYMRRNQTADVRYVALRYAAIPNDSVSVSESDLRDYYQRHREDFKRERTYTINYATLSKEATEQDTAAVVNELNRLRSDFAAVENDSLFLAQNFSEREYTSAYFTRDELEPAVADAVFSSNLEPGTVVGPVRAGSQVHLIKMQDVKQAEEPVVRASHILIRTEDEGDEQAQQQIQDLQQQLQQGADFAQLARQYSDDGSASRGGDLGWFGRGRMVEPFEEAAFNAGVGEVVGPVQTRFGYHLIKVTGRSDRAVQLADFALEVRPDRATLENTREKLGDLAYYASESGDFEQEAERLDINLQQMQVEAEQEVIPGIGRSRSLQTFLSNAKRGAVSDVIELDDAYLVAHVEDIQKAGYRSFEEVRSEIEPRVYLEKKRQIQVERLQNALQNQTFDGLAAAVGATVRTADGVSLQNPVIPGIGREPKFVGTAFGLNEGETSRVVEGENAAFVLQLQELQEPTPITEQERQNIRQQLLRQRRAQVQQYWTEALREQASVEDRRSLFRQ